MSDTHVAKPNRRRIPGLAELVNGGNCPHSGKVRYLDQRTATRALEQIAVQDPERDRLSTYRCKCGDWHVGHRNR